MMKTRTRSVTKKIENDSKYYNTDAEQHFLRLDKTHFLYLTNI